MTWSGAEAEVRACGLLKAQGFRIVATARRFMQEVGAELPARFDVVTFSGDTPRLHRDAFRAD